MTDLLIQLTFEDDDVAFAKAVRAHPEVLQATDEFGATLLHHFARDVQRLAQLFTLAGECGVTLDLDVRDERGNTPLHEAQWCPEEVLFLLARGADPNALNNDGEVALDPESQVMEEVRAQMAGTKITSLAQLAQAALDKVEIIELSERPDHFPEAILGCTRLRSLHLGMSQHVVLPEALTALPLESVTVLSAVDLPASIGRMTRLRELHVMPTALPDAIGQLSQLKRLTLRHGSLTALPHTLGDLESLEELDISYTPVASLPDSIGRLARLRKLEASATRLGSLPDSLAELSALTHLGLGAAAFVSVPEVLYGMSGVVRRGFDNVPGFAGWDRPKGARPVHPDASLYARTALSEELDALIEELNDWCLEEMENELGDRVPASLGLALRQVARHGVALTTTEPATYAQLGVTRIGGRPDLVDGQRPEGTFVAQLDLETLAPLQDYLPRKGLLSFYVVDQAESGSVVYVPDKTQLTGTDPAASEHPGFQATARAGIQVPRGYNDGWVLKDEAAILEHVEDLGDHCVDGDHHINAYILTQTGGPQVDAAAHHGGMPTDWVILLAVSSEGACNFWWGSGLDLAFVIHKDALLARDFSIIYVDIGM